MAEQAYFDRYPNFTPTPQSTALANFARLASSQHWRPNGKKYKAERDAYLTALADAHISSIDVGSVEEKLAALKGLCQQVGIVPVPGTIKQCKKVWAILRLWGPEGWVLV